MQRNRDCSPSVPLPCSSTMASTILIHLHGHLRETKTAADLRCIIIKSIESWFLTGEIGWSQVLRGYIPYDWTSRQETFFRRQRKKYHTGERWTKELIQFFWTHSTTLWKDRCKVAHAPGEDSPDNSSARTRQAALLRPMHTPCSCSLTTGVSSTYH
jgi:hypothetical protein